MAHDKNAIAPAPEPGAGTVAAHGIKLAGEAFVAPGSSLLLNGEVLAGGAHLLGGLLAKWALGPVGLALVAANSYSLSVSQKSLPDLVKARAKTEKHE